MASTHVLRDKTRGRTLSVEVPSIVYRVVVIFAIGAFLTFTTEGFLTLNNLLNVLRQSSLLFLIASGLTLVLIAGGFDLSVTANLALSAATAAITMKATGSPLLGSLAGLGCGAIIGTCNGVLITSLKLPPFIATYGVLWVVQGITNYIMPSGPIFGFPESFRQLGSGYFLGIPVPIYVMIAAWLLGTLFATRTNFGRELYAIGANRVTAGLSGIPVNRRLFLIYILCGVMASLAGLVYLARVNAAEPGIGTPLLLPAVAAIVVGGTSLYGGSGNLLGTLIGSMVLTLLINGMNLLNLESSLQPLVTGLVVLVSVTIDTISSRRSQ